MRAEEIAHLKAELKKMSMTGLHQVLGDSYGIKHFFLPIFLNLMNNDTQHTAAYGSIFTLLNFVTITGISTLFQLPSKMSALFSDLQTAESESEKQTAKDKIIELIRYACIYSIAIIPTLMLPLYFSKALLTTVFHQHDSIASIAQSFLRPYSLFLIPTPFIVTFSGIIIGTGHTKIFLLGSTLLAACLLFTGLFSLQKDKSFEDNLHSLLKFYIAEAYGSALLYFSYIFFHPDYSVLDFKNAFFSEFSFNWSAFKDFLKDGVTSTVRIACDFLFPFILATLAAQLKNNPEESQAAFALASQPQWLNSLINVFFALAAAKSLSDAKDNKTISSYLFKLISYSGIALTVAVSSIVSVISALFPTIPALILGNNNPIVLTILTSITKPIALASWLDSVCFTTMFQAQSGWNDFLIGCIARFVGLIAGLAAAAIFGFGLNMGATGLALGFPIAMIPTLLILGRDYFKGINMISAEKETKRHHWDFYQSAQESEMRTAIQDIAVVTIPIATPTGTDLSALTH